MSNETPTPDAVEPADQTPEAVDETVETPAAGAPGDIDEAPASETPEVAESATDAPDAEVVTEVPEAEAMQVPEPVEEAAAAAVEPASDPVDEVVTEAAVEVAEETVTEAADEKADEPVAAEAPVPVAPKPSVPSPAAFAAKVAAARPSTVPAPVSDHSASARFGRVAEDGTVFIVIGEEERAVGSYPGASADDALQYFARKYDELFGMAELLEQRLATSSELTAKDAAEQFKHLSAQMVEPAFVGDLAGLQAKLDSIATAVEARREEESAARAAAKAAAAVEREALVARAEKIAAQDPAKVQWKRSGEELRGIFDEWKAQQRSGARLDKPVETELWQRFSAARTTFDKARRAHFTELESTQSEAKQLKERLVAEAEKLSTSKDWAQTPREFKRLMDRWRAAGRAGRADDDALWERFKTAQDTFFNAKDAVTAAEDESFRGNLSVKEALLTEANALLPITDLEAAKASLRSIQDRWDKAGKVPRADIDRTEKALRRVESAVRDAEEKKWSSSNPEALARARSLVDQLETAVAGLEKDLEAARAKGNEKKVKEAEAALEARQAWLEQARAGLAEFS